MTTEILNLIVKSLKIKFPVATISRDLKISKGVVSEYLNGKKVPSNNFKELFENFYGIKTQNFDSKKEGSTYFLEKQGVKITIQEIVTFIVENEKVMKQNKTFMKFIQLEVERAENKTLKEFIARKGN